MTPTVEPGEQPPSRIERLTAWMREHPRATGAGAIVSALVLVGVTVVLGWMLLADRPQVGRTDATPTATPEPTSEASASPSGSPTPTDSTAPSPSLDPGLGWPPIGTDPGPLSGAYMVWATVTVDDLNVRSGPDPEDSVVGQLNAGDLVLAPYGIFAEGWYQVVADGVAGYVNGGPAADPYLLATKTPWNAHVTNLAGVASDGSAYVAFGPERASDYLSLGGDAGSLILYSTDGETWTEVDGPDGTVFSVAGGPSGFIAFSGGHGGVTWTTFSPDGLTWGESVFGAASSAAEGPGGWVAATGSGVMRSADGLTWDEPVTLGDGSSSVSEIAASEAGYVVYERGATEAWTSSDGVTWSQLQVADGLGIVDIELDGDRLHLLGTLADDGRPILLPGTLASSGAAAIDGGSPVSIDVADYSVHGISASPDGLLALGWNIADLVPVAWTSEDGATWAREDLATDALGGSVGQPPVWGSAGWIALGTATEGAGVAPASGMGRPWQAIDGAAQELWRSADGAEWVATGDPIAYEGPLPPCPPTAGVSTLVLLYLGSFANACFGETTLTIRGHVPSLEGLGGCCWATPDPIWLAGPYPGAFLTPAAEDEMALFSLYVPPGVDTSALAADSWVEIVGHFDDPAAETCRRTPLVSPPMGLEALESVRADCASRFVVESVRSVDGP